MADTGLTFHCDEFLDEEKLDGVVNIRLGQFYFNMLCIRMCEVFLKNYIV